MLYFGTPVLSLVSNSARLYVLAARSRERGSASVCVFASGGFGARAGLDEREVCASDVRFANARSAQMEPVRMSFVEWSLVFI